MTVEGKTLRSWSRILLLLLCAMLLIQGCGGSNDTSMTTSSSDYIFESKAEPVAMEADLLADESLALTTERNVALFLTDPDNSISRSWYSDAETRAREAMKVVPVKIEATGSYQICNEHHPDKDQRLQTLLMDGAGNELLSVTDEGCKSIDLTAGDFVAHVGAIADDLQDSHEWPVFLTITDNRIRSLFNGCPKCDLRGLDLRNRTLKKTDLNHANLEGRLAENTRLMHVVGDGSNLLSGRHFDVIAQDEFNRSLSANPELTSVTDISRSWWHKVSHAVTHPVDTIEKVVHTGEEVVHKFIEYSDSAELTALLMVLSPAMEEGHPSNDKILGHRWAKTISAQKLPVPGGALPAVVGMSEVDHTYLKLQAYDNEHHDAVETLAFGAFGNNSGGETVVGTDSDCPNDRNDRCIDTNTVAYLMEKSPCKWPVTTGYARVGVCWNLVNRGLYYTGKTVKNVPYYTVIETTFGTFGAEGTFGGGLYDDLTAPYAMSKCLDSQKQHAPWGGHDFGALVNYGRSLTFDSVSADSVDPRIRLYQDYHEGANGFSRSLDSDEKFSYLQNLLRLNIEEKLGTIATQTMNDLLEIHAFYLPQLSELRNASELSYTAINELMKAQLQEYLNVLGEENYMKLMGLDEMESFDLQHHAPQ